MSLETGRKPIQPAGFDKAPRLLIKKSKASWALRLPARPGRLKARPKAHGLAGPVSNTESAARFPSIVGVCVRTRSGADGDDGDGDGDGDDDGVGDGDQCTRST